jgi:hypothetical protein
LTLSSALRAAGILLGIVLLVGAVGMGVGRILSSVTGDGGHDPVTGAPVPASPATGASSGQAPAPSAPRQIASRAANGVRVHVFSAALHPAATASGIRRKRARISMRVRVTNNSAAPLTPTDVVLLSPRGTVRGTPGHSLRSLLKRGHRRDSKIRFETAGDVTDGIVSARETEVRIAGVKLAVTVVVGNPVTRKRRH